MTELLSKPENDAPVQVKQTIEKFETKLLEAGKAIDDAQAQVDALNFRSNATDHIMTKAELRDAKTEHQPQLDGLGAEWLKHGGARLDAARTAVEALNFRSNATDHVKAKTELRDAEDAWVKSYRDAQSEAGGEVYSDGDFDAEAQEENVPETPSVDDLVKVGKNGDTFHKPDGTFISAEHMSSIKANQDQIRGGLEDIDVKPEKTSQPAASNTEAQSGPTENESDDGDKEALEGESLEEYEARHGVKPENSSEVSDDSNVDASEDNPELDDEKLDTSGLDDEILDDDAEKRSIWKKILDKISDTRASIYTSAGMTILGLGKLMSGPEPQENETQEDYEKRAKKYGRRLLLGTVAVVGAVIATKFAIDHSFSGGGNGAGNAPAAEATPGHISTPESADYNNITPPEVPASIEFNPDAYNVVPGEGWYNTFKEMGITDATEQANLLRKVGPQLQDMGWAYPMGQDSWGISQPGQLPNDVLELIQNSR